jgi:hypothetical protein
MRGDPQPVGGIFAESRHRIRRIGTHRMQQLADEQQDGTADGRHCPNL